MIIDAYELFIQIFPIEISFFYRLKFSRLPYCSHICSCQKHMQYSMSFRLMIPFRLGDGIELGTLCRFHPSINDGIPDIPFLLRWVMDWRTNEIPCLLRKKKKTWSSQRDDSTKTFLTNIKKLNMYIYL